MTLSAYRGRFAPSPTGPLHFGSLVTALASYLEARTRDGEWLVRIEDLDPLRESPEAAEQILHSLQAHGLQWDGEVRYQSSRLTTYRLVADELMDRGRAYYCGCSRKELKAHGGRHPHHCRDGTQIPDDRPLAIRFALQDEQAQWHDRILGGQHQSVRAEVDDPVIIRKEGFIAYQLAVVVDDIDQGISDVVRGSDLLETTAQQRQIFQVLDAPTPSWAHIPVVLNRDGQKLSKQNHAPALDDSRPSDNLWHALSSLGQQPPRSLRSEAPTGLLAWARDHWSLGAIPLEHALEP